METQNSAVSDSGIRDIEALDSFLKDNPDIPLMKVAFHIAFGNCCLWWLDQRDARMNFIGLNSVVYFLWKFGVLKYKYRYDREYFRPTSIGFEVGILHRIPYVYNLKEMGVTGIDRLGEFATNFLEGYPQVTIEQSNFKPSEIRAVEKIRMLLKYNPINTSDYTLLNNIAWLDLLASVSCLTLDVDKAHPERINRELLYQNWPHYIGIDEVEKAIAALCKHSSEKRRLISIENWNY